MSTNPFSHLDDHTLLCRLAAFEAQDSATSSASCAHFAEAEARQIRLPDDYVSLAALQSEAEIELMTSLGPGRYTLLLTIDEGIWDKLRYAQTLLSCILEGNAFPTVIDRALDALIEKLERDQVPSESSRRSRWGRLRKT
ncbi:MAG TPA: hypothetical protein VGK89_00620 [Candidatus Eisenbacteria bacterium]|jgi:hypothetical protein